MTVFLLTILEKSCPAMASTGRGPQLQVLRLAALRMQRDLTLGSGNYRYVTGAAGETCARAKMRARSNRQNCRPPPITPA
jgi:hypothetical protein